LGHGRLERRGKIVSLVFLRVGIGTKLKYKKSSKSYVQTTARKDTKIWNLRGTESLVKNADVIITRGIICHLSLIFEVNERSVVVVAVNEIGAILIESSIRISQSL